MALDSRSRQILLEGAAELGITLSRKQQHQFDTYAGLLQLWGSKINLTSRLSPEEIVIYHFLDSLAGLEVTGTGDFRLADLGTGAGFPGIPLKIASPGIDLCLLESSHKKISFCREVAARAGLGDIAFVAERAEAAGRDKRYRGSCDWVVTRAFRNAAEALRLALPLLKESGSLLLYKGSPGGEEAGDLEAEAERQVRAVRSLAVRVPFLDAARTFLVVSPKSGA